MNEEEQMRKRQEEQEKEMERRRKEEHTRILFDIASRVVDATPEKTEHAMKRREREVLDAIIESFRWGQEDGRHAQMHKDQSQNMLREKNLISSFPKMSNEQLKHFKKEYEKKVDKLKKEKIDKGVELTPPDRMMVETYKAIMREVAKRQQQEINNNNINEMNEENDRRNARSGR